jgi:hypothetical protein
VDRKRLYVYDELKSMGLGLRELKIILDTIKELQLNIIVAHLRHVINLLNFSRKGMI